MRGALVTITRRAIASQTIVIEQPHILPELIIPI